MIYLRSAVWLIYFFLYLIVMLPKSIYMKHLKKQGRIAECDAYIRKASIKWASSLMKLAGCKVEITGRENIPKDRAVLFTPNHQGMYDVPIMLTSLDKPNGLVAKKEAAHYPMLSTWMKYLHCVFIDRENPREGLKALNETAENIQNGYSMVIFPEGTRSKSDELGEFKGGAFKIAQKCQCPIIPVCIDGSYKIMEANGGLKMRPGTVRVKILPPIETKGMSREEFRRLPQRVHDLIAESKGN